MPPFVGAVALQLFFGRNGSVNLLLDDWFGFKVPFMDGLNGVVFVQSIHYFPFILINLSAALRNIDRSMEEAAQNLGSSGFRLFRRIVFPLALPGYVAGASLVFVKVFDDLATPLLLNVKDMLAPQAYLRVTSIGITDPMGYVISVVLIVTSVAAMWASSLATRNIDYATVQRGGGGIVRRRLKPWETAAAYAVITLILLLVLAPHFGLLLLSFATIWSFSPLPDAYTVAHYARVFGESSLYIKNTLIYASLAGLIDIVVGTSIAYLVLRTKLPGRVSARHHRDGRARHSRHCSRHRLSAGLLRRSIVGRHTDRIALDHHRARARDSPPALRAARLSMPRFSRFPYRSRRPLKISAPPRSAQSAAW